jgi:hypothetical protein
MLGVPMMLPAVVPWEFGAVIPVGVTPEATRFVSRRVGPRFKTGGIKLRSRIQAWSWCCLVWASAAVRS